MGNHDSRSEIFITTYAFNNFHTDVCFAPKICPETEVLDIAFSLRNQLLCMLMGIFTSYFISDVLSAFTMGGYLFGNQSVSLL